MAVASGDLGWGEWSTMAPVTALEYFVPDQPSIDGQWEQDIDTADGNEEYKKHAACDECRKRKLKCSGEPTGCSRCVKQNLVCHYSQRKQMGRPRKKQRLGEDGRPTVSQALDNSTDSNQPYIHCNITDQAALLANDVLCPKPIATFVTNYTPPPRMPFITQGTIYEQQRNLTESANGADSDITPPAYSPPTPSNADPYPPPLSSWPDYSTMLNLPTMVTHKSDSNESDISFESTNNLPTLPSCPCLANLYLTLSTLSTLPSFPVSCHTLETLQTATRTAHSVIYCPVCPTKFQSGMQNVMLLGTLLCVLADSWNRIRKTPAQEIHRGFGSPACRAVECGIWNDEKGAYWSQYAHYLVRQHVFGDPPPPNISLPGCGSTHYDGRPPIILIKLCDAMERRQKTWHGDIESTGEFPQHQSPREVMKDMGQCANESERRELHIENGGHLCLKIVDQVRMVMKTMDSMPKRAG